MGVTNYAASFGAKNVQKTKFEAAEMMLGPWNQQEWPKFHDCRTINCNKIKIDTERATLVNFKNIIEFSRLPRPPVTKKDVL